MIKYSIVVPCYNVGENLPEFLNNIPIDRDDFELIFVNDASTDNTKIILESFIKKSTLFRLINHDKNKGVSLAIMSGIKSMTTHWYARLDPDDLVFKKYFDIIPKYINEKNSLIRFKFKRINTKGKICQPYFTWRIYFKASWGWSCLINLKATSIPHMTRRRFADDLFLFATTYRKNNLKHIFINKYLYAYRNLRNHSMSNTITKQSIEDLKIGYQFYKNNPDIKFTPRKYVQQVFIRFDIRYRQNTYDKLKK